MPWHDGDLGCNFHVEFPSEQIDDFIILLKKLKNAIPNDISDEFPNRIYL